MSRLKRAINHLCERLFGIGEVIFEVEAAEECAEMFLFGMEKGIREYEKK